MTTVEITGQWGGRAGAIVTYNTGSISLDEMIAVRDAVEAWIAGAVPVLVIPSGVRVEVYGVPKAGGSGLVYETRSGDAATRLEAPDLPTLKAMIAEPDEPKSDAITADSFGDHVATAAGIVAALAAADPYEWGSGVVKVSAPRCGPAFADGIAKSPEHGKAAAACSCPLPDLMARGCTCGAVVKP
jgi:hypothetical protein